MADDIAIKVNNVHKTFMLPHEKKTSVKSLFVSMFHGKRTYEKQHVLKGVSFEIKKGEFFGIVGRNGSGKSTLLKMLAGIYEPDKGAIQVNGKLTPFIELGVGFNPELTGRENVFLNGALLGFSREEMAAMYDEIVEFAELDKFMDQRLKNYSSGMQVRLAFSIAIRADSDILLLDEVLAVGDEAFQRKCKEYFKTLKASGKTVILVTHSMQDVKEYCSRALMIHDGEVVIDGNPDDVANKYIIENTVSNKAEEVEKNDISDALSDVKVTLLSKEIVSEKDEVKVLVEYKISRNMHTQTYVNLLDINRGFSLYAASTLTKPDKRGYVRKIFRVRLSEPNDTSIQVAVSICDKESRICVFLPHNTLPTFLLRRSDYPDPDKRPTYAVMFSRGKWTDEE